MTNLTEALDREFPEAWRPDPGDKLVGTLVDVSEYDGGYGAYPVLVIRGDDGAEHAWHAMHSVARGEVGRLQPRIGERLGVKYLGKQISKSGVSYNGWRVAGDRKPGDVIDLSAYAHDDDGPAPDVPVPSDAPPADVPPEDVPV